MIRLIRIELFKLFKQRRTYLALAALVVIECVVLAVAYNQGAEILDALLEGLSDSFYMSGNLLNGNLLVYLILNSLWFHLPLILMIIVTGLITTEFEDGTVRTIFVQPLSRTSFIIAKYVVASLFTILCVLFLAVTSIGLAYLLFGQGDLAVYLGGLIFFEQEDALFRLVLAFFVGSVSVLFYVFASLTLAVWLRRTIKTWILAALLLIVSNLLLQLRISYAGVDSWFYIGQLDSWQYLFRRAIPWGELIRSQLVLIGYVLATAAVGIWYFNRKEIG